MGRVRRRTTAPLSCGRQGARACLPAFPLPGVALADSRLAEAARRVFACTQMVPWLVPPLCLPSGACAGRPTRRSASSKAFSSLVHDRTHPTLQPHSSMAAPPTAWAELNSRLGALLERVQAPCSQEEAAAPIVVDCFLWSKLAESAAEAAAAAPALRPSPAEREALTR